MKCRKVTHRYHSLRHVRSVENPSLPGPLSFFSQNYGGYRAMQRKVREQHKLTVPRNLVYDVMSMVDPGGMTRRGNVGQK